MKPFAVVRRALLRSAALAAVVSFRPSTLADVPRLPGALALPPAVLPPAVLPPAKAPPTVTLPLYSMGSAFCTEYYVDGKRFRGVVDTGSPFLLVDGSITSSFERWGRFAGDDAPLSVPLGDVSGEMYGGQDVDVEWRRGSLRLAGYASERDQTSSLRDREAGARSGSWTRPGRFDALFEPINFGVVRRYEGRGGGGAIYLGLAKERQPGRTRPTFLEQTDIQSLQFDFVRRTLVLANRPLLSAKRDAIPLVDLRPVGAPVAAYAIKVHRLIANGRPLPLAREALAVVDTGTTGLVIGDSLYDSDEMPLPGAAVRRFEVEVLTESGRVVTLSAARRPRARAGAVDGVTAPGSAESFPLITTPVSLEGWFARRSSSAEPPPHVLFLGLAFLSNLRLTIDADAGRLAAQVVGEVREA